jgi:hydroxymethylbilane synthase
VKFDAVLLAAAGIARLGSGARSRVARRRDDAARSGPGRARRQCRAGDAATLELLAAVDDAAARAATTRALVPARARGGLHRAGRGARDQIAGERVYLNGLVASPDGREVVRVSGTGQPEEIGERLAREALHAGAEAFSRRSVAEAHSGASGSW